MIKVSDKNLRLIFWTYAKFTMEKPERYQLSLCCLGVFIVNFEYIQQNIWE